MSPVSLVMRCSIYQLHIGSKVWTATGDSAIHVGGGEHVASGDEAVHADGIKIESWRL